MRNRKGLTLFLMIFHNGVGLPAFFRPPPFSLLASPWGFRVSFPGVVSPFRLSVVWNRCSFSQVLFGCPGRFFFQYFSLCFGLRSARHVRSSCEYRFFVGINVLQIFLLDLGYFA